MNAISQVEKPRVQFRFGGNKSDCGELSVGPAKVNVPLRRERHSGTGQNSTGP